MSTLFNNLTILFIALCSMGIVLQLIRRPSRAVYVQLSLLVITTIILHFSFGFPMAGSNLIAFGDSTISPFFIFVVMIIGVFLGGVAEYLYYINDQPFCWRSLFLPLLPSPIVVLPLYELFDKVDVNEIEIIWVFLLSFQNGWFWKTVLARANPRES